MLGWCGCTIAVKDDVGEAVNPATFLVRIWSIQVAELVVVWVMMVALCCCAR